MIKRLHVKNYKSFKEMEVELGKFNVIIGPNASGKSNFIELLKFISSKEFFDEFLTKLGGFKACKRFYYIN